VSENERQQRMLERVQEDERLRGDLPDDAATALVEWASRRVAIAAAEPTRPDAEVEAEVQAIRAAARAAARAGQTEPQRVLAIAETKLAQGTVQAARPVTMAPVAEQPAQPPIAASPAAEQPAPQQPTTNLAAEVGAGAARSQPPAAALPSQESTASVSQPTAPSKVEQQQHQNQSPWFRRWKPFASFLKRIRGGR
jgi:hypothetical protein